MKWTWNWNFYQSHISISYTYLHPTKYVVMQQYIELHCVARVKVLVRVQSHQQTWDTYLKLAFLIFNMRT
jgi:hypothetical protein